MYLSFRNHKMAVNRFDNKERQTAFQHEPRRRQSASPPSLPRIATWMRERRRRRVPAGHSLAAFFFIHATRLSLDLREQVVCSFSFFQPFMA